MKSNNKTHTHTPIPYTITPSSSSDDDHPTRDLPVPVYHYYTLHHPPTSHITFRSIHPNDIYQLICLHNSLFPIQYPLSFYDTLIHTPTPTPTHAHAHVHVSTT